MNKNDLVVITGLFIIAFFLYSLPLRPSQPFNAVLPYGEADSAYHYALAGSIAAQDHVFKATESLPMMYGYWHGGGKPIPSAYPPTYHVSMAMEQEFSANQLLSGFIFTIICSILIVLPTYLLVRKLYGQLAGIVASLGLAFSYRNIMIFVWGQHPSLFSFAFVPAVIYCLHRYAEGAYAKKEQPIFLYLTAALMASQFVLHVQALITSVLAVIFMAAFILLKERHLPKINLRTLLIAVIIGAAITVPLIPFYLETGLSGGQFSADQLQLSRLFRWGIMPEEVSGNYPPDYVSFSTNFGQWTIPFILLAVLFLLLRHKREDLTILAWLAAVYVSIHLDLFGYTNYEIRTTARMLVAESALFFTLIGISIPAIAGLLRPPEELKVALKYGAAAVVICLLLFFNARPAYELLANAYQGVGRLTPLQLEAAYWLKANVPASALVYAAGDKDILTNPKARWMLAVSQRSVTINIDNYLSMNLTPQYVIVDYSDSMLTGRTAEVQRLTAVEKSLANSTKLYDKDNIKVYRTA